MIYLDTHFALWLYTAEETFISPQARQAFESDVPVISGMVVLELGYLHEIGRVKVSAVAIVDALKQQFELSICDASFAEVVHIALQETWTRDPFDRLIVANARLRGTHLITKDARILENYDKAVW